MAYNIEKMLIYWIKAIAHHQLATLSSLSLEKTFLLIALSNYCNMHFQRHLCFPEKLFETNRKWQQVVVSSIYHNRQLTSHVKKE